MKVKAQAKYIRESPFKVRRVLDMVRGMPVEDAQVVLSHLNRGASEPVSKVLKSAIANAEICPRISLNMRLRSASASARASSRIV